MKKLVLIALASTAIATPALAREDGDLSGVRAGALVGLDSVTLDDGVDDGSESDFLFGGFIGYDHDFGNFVLGAEAEITESSVSRTETDLLVAGDTGTLSAGRDIYLGARAGVQVGPSGMIYAKAGYTNAKGKLTYTDTTGTISGSDELDGFRVGVGAEFMVMNNAFVRAEYRYSDYGEYQFQGVGTGIDVSRHQGVVGFGFVF